MACHSVCGQQRCESTTAFDFKVRYGSCGNEVLPVEPTRWLVGRDGVGTWLIEADVFVQVGAKADGFGDSISEPRRPPPSNMPREKY